MGSQKMPILRSDASMLNSKKETTIRNPTRRQMNVAQIMYTHIYMCKNDTCRNCSRNLGRGDERRVEGGKFKYNIVGGL
jgi:hypothetical protein